MNWSPRADAGEPETTKQEAESDSVIGHSFLIIGISRRGRVVARTEEAIKNYFTQIGKSYYRCPEFNQERAAMAF
jgi:hypothetical protein